MRFCMIPRNPENFVGGTVPQNITEKPNVVRSGGSARLVKLVDQLAERDP